MKKNLRIVSQILLHATVVLSAVYILFYILDNYNPMLHFLAKLPAIDFIIAILALAAGVVTIVAWEQMRKHKN
ncbi:MAG: hypothetical protein FWE69_03720 [Clostridiales bacterium]|nr:hypothetical protein [Clostridiales bacterium]